MIASMMLMASAAALAQSLAGTATITFHEQKTGTTISHHIYGHFSEHLGHCIYDGLWVGKDSEIPNIGGVRKDVFDALKQIRIPTDMMWGLSLHYYTIPGPWEHKGSATEFTRNDFFRTMAYALNIEDAIVKQDSVMSIYDPEKKGGDGR